MHGRTPFLIVMISVPMALAAQDPIPVPLKPATAVMDSFAGAWGARELSDGRAVVADARNTFVVDFDHRTRELIPSVMSQTLTALPADSTLITARGIWIFLDGPRLLGMLPASNPVVTAAADLHGADSAGHVLAVEGGQPASDSATVVLIDRATGMQHPVARVWESTPAIGGVPAPTFVVNEQPVLMLDGWIAIVRANPYRVDWRSLDGHWTHGAPLPVRPIAMDAREIAAYTARGAGVPSADTRWVVPFTHPSPVATPEGDVLVRRTPTADYPDTRYDVIDRTGALVREVILAAGFQNIVGFGRHSVYVQVGRPRASAVLERHPWP